MIRTVNLTKKYGDMFAIKNINLSLEQGDVFGFIGPNGAGKTTTMRILSTLLEPSHGEAYVCGHSIYDQPREIRLKRGEAVVLEFTSLDQPDPPALPVLPAEEAGLKGDLDALLATLRPAEREVLFLHYHQGHTAEEIAQRHGQARGTVLSLIHRAIAKLCAAAGDTLGSPACNQWLLFFVPFL